MYANKQMLTLRIGQFVHDGNFCVLLLQILLICGVSLITLKMGEKALNSWLCIVAVGMNLFVTKQINLFGLDVTATDSFAVSYLLGLSLIQEFYGRSAARQHVAIAMVVSVFFVGLSFTHLLYTPSQYDVMHPHFAAILSPMPRIMIASLVSFGAVQLLDILFFQWLRLKTAGRWFTLRTGICLILSQLTDTFLFSILGLYGLIENICDVMLLSLIVKGIVIGLSLPFVTIATVVNKKPQKVLGS